MVRVSQTICDSNDKSTSDQNQKQPTGVAEPPRTDNALVQLVAHLDTRIDKLEILLKELVQQRAVKDWYSTEEVARIVDRAEYTVRNWCLDGRIKAEKKGSGRGRYQSWVVSHAELQRFHKEGLRPRKT